MYLRLFCAVAAAGVLSAQALGQVELPGVTVTVPTVPVPLPTPPAPPVPAVPTPPAPQPPVAVPQGARRPRAPVATPSGPSSSAPAAPSTGGSSSTAWSYSGARPSARTTPSRPAEVTRIQADKWRATTRGKHRRAATITYTLSAASRVRFLVRGPAPSCGVVARFVVSGRAGKNRLRFTGKIGRRRLEPGTYRIVARPRKGRASRSIAVVVGDGPVTGTACAARADSAAASAIFGTLTSAFGGALPGSDSATRSTKRSGVLPAIRQRVQQLPSEEPEALPKAPIGGISDPQGLPTWLLGLAIPLAGLLGIVLGASALGYLRRRSAYY